MPFNPLKATSCPLQDPESPANWRKIVPPPPWGRHSAVRQAKSFPTSLQQTSLLATRKGAGVLSNLEVWRFDWRASHGRVLSCEGWWSYIRTAWAPSRRWSFHRKLRACVGGYRTAMTSSLVGQSASIRSRMPRAATSSHAPSYPLETETAFKALVP